MEYSPAAVKSPGVGKIAGDGETLVGTAVGSITDIEPNAAAPAIVVIVLKTDGDDRVDPVLLAVARSGGRRGIREADGAVGDRVGRAVLGDGEPVILRNTRC